MATSHTKARTIPNRERLGDQYNGYTQALGKVELETLQERERKICENFVRKAPKNPNYKHWFKFNDVTNRKPRKTKENVKQKYELGQSGTKRYRNSPLPLPYRTVESHEMKPKQNS